MPGLTKPQHGLEADHTMRADAAGRRVPDSGAIRRRDGICAVQFYRLAAGLLDEGRCRLPP
jgi:hypothetical protein